MSTAFAPSPTVADTSAALTAADLVDKFGPIRLSRIRWEPLPGTATDEDYFEQLPSCKVLELVDGVLVEKPKGYEEGRLAMRLGFLLMTFIEEHDLGECVGPDGMLTMSTDNIRLPDVSFTAKDRAPKDRSQAAPRIAPNLCVEILSPSNTKREIENKVAEFFASGVDVVWIIDPKAKSALIYRDGQIVDTLDEAGVLKGEGPLAGFELSLSELFRMPDGRP
ncbi:Uma2 family endonuclease [Stratiformator vulcanicus]|uniref:Putative restriction endonuclease domain-containing protein n=1 Tax=Stratiformator vulcanicus TaxID=2527980 RepID=A0A517QVR3_9PLAN|nr:Uma2 family endonuclease [Stratiformator vulcanicus]QDT35742.1 hypothetical protein Pan189_00950 [Stratiformator vulcanicus]